ITIQRCSNASTTAEIWVTDLGTNKQSAVTSMNVTSGSVNAGQLAACASNTAGFINYTIDGVQHAFTVPPDSIRTDVVNMGQPVTNIEGATKTQPYQLLQFGFNGTTTGSHQVAYLSVFMNNSTLVKDGNINVNILEYGAAPNGYIEGNFSGNLRDSSSAVLHPISCNFKVKRQ
ncbi:MAG: hypothetical protein WCF67_03515, partial [Chitinophagaceae bacterium]